MFKEDWHDRKKRSAADEEGFQHPTVVSHEDKWIAGVCMTCERWGRPVGFYRFLMRLNMRRRTALAVLAVYRLYPIVVRHRNAAVGRGIVSIHDANVPM